MLTAGVAAAKDRVYANGVPQRQQRHVGGPGERCVFLGVRVWMADLSPICRRSHQHPGPRQSRYLWCPQVTKRGITEGMMTEIMIEEPIPSPVVGAVTTNPHNCGRTLWLLGLKRQRAWPPLSPEIYRTMAGQG